MDYHLGNMNWLRVNQGDTNLTSRLKIPHGENFEDCLPNGSVIAGSPATVRAAIERQVKELGINYLVTYLFLGTMSLADATAVAQSVPHRGHAASGEAVSIRLSAAHSRESDGIARP